MWSGKNGVSCLNLKWSRQAQPGEAVDMGSSERLASWPGVSEKYCRGRGQGRSLAMLTRE